MRIILIILLFCSCQKEVQPVTPSMLLNDETRQSPCVAGVNFKVTVFCRESFTNLIQGSVFYTDSKLIYPYKPNSNNSWYQVRETMNDSLVYVQINAGGVVSSLYKCR